MDRLKAGIAAAMIVTAGTAIFFSTKENGSDHTTDKAITAAVQYSDGEEMNPLEKNAYEEINDLVDFYYACISNGDVDGVSAIAADVDEHTKVQVENNGKFVETYKNIDVYTKAGLKEDSYIVFAAYEMKIRDMDTLVPGLETLYASKDENGVYQIEKSGYDPETENYMKEVSGDEDVQKLVKEVQLKYAQAKESDKVLKAALDDLSAAYSE